MPEIQYKRSTDFVGFATQDYFLTSSGTLTATATNGAKLLVRAGQRVSRTMRDTYPDIVVAARLLDQIVLSDEPSLVVENGGTTVVNGTYTQRGTYGGHPYYNKVGAISRPVVSAVVWSIADNRYVIIDDGTEIVYQQTVAGLAQAREGVYEVVGLGGTPVPTVRFVG